jgi:alpha-ketoglutarate-dependent 2,4-dichlorophenoxyacetate dioxygenase
MKARLAGLEAVHSIATGRARLGFTDFTAAERAALPPKRHPLVRRIPGPDGRAGRRALFVGAHTGAIPGMPLAEARLLLADLTGHATQPEFVWRHHWRDGDLVMWDNRAVLHRGRPYDMDVPRDIRRTTLADLAHGPSPLAGPADAHAA